jgi:polyisoprenoid-binding protein YceI
MITTVRGTFKGITGIIEFDPDKPEHTTVEATIDVKTLHTGTADREKHLLSADFFWVDEYPTMRFKSQRVEPSVTNTRAKLGGELTIRDVTKNVTLDVEYFGGNISLEGETRIGFSATTWVNREDFGLLWNQMLQSGTYLIDKDVKITLDVQATLVPEAVSADAPEAVPAQV